MVQLVSEANQTDSVGAGRNSISLTAGELRTVKVENLESELSALWHAAAKDSKPEHPVTRASVLTLLVYVESEAEGLETLNLVADIMHQNPCRAIVMVADRDAKPDSLVTSISARCRLAAGGGKQVCCEQIVVRAHGGSVDGLDSVVVPLTIPGLPVYLWWRAKRFDPPDFLRDVLRRTDRLVVDSSLFPDPDTGLRDLARQIAHFSGPHAIAFTDLNWSRLTPWRETIAQAFSSPAEIPLLSRVTDIRIEWLADAEQEGGRAAKALLMASWLAGRLGWKPASSLKHPHGVRELFFEAGPRTARIELHRRSGQKAKEVPFAVQIEVGDESPSSFAFRETKDSTGIVMRLDAAGRAAKERKIQTARFDEVSLFHEEIRHSSRDEIYEEALGVAARLCTL